MHVKSFVCSLAVWLGWPVLLALAQPDKYGQFAPARCVRENSASLACSGSENEWSRRQFEASKMQGEPKRLGQRLMLAIQDGRPELAAQWSREYLAQNPRQLEALFALAVAEAKLGDVDQAFDTTMVRNRRGASLRTLCRRPARLLKPLTSSSSFKKYLAGHPVRLVHRPRC